MWSKEFSGLDTPGQQISHLRGILTGLGMTGRFSLEKAREIKAKRELAQELGQFVVMLSEEKTHFALLRRGCANVCSEARRREGRTGVAIEREGER